MGAAAATTAGADAATTASTAAGGASAASTALPFVGLGVNVLQMGMGLMQASEQRAAQREAERQAAIATKMRIQQQEQNFFEAMQVPTEAYDRALREGTAQQAQALASLQEGDPRQLLGGVGKVQAAAGDYNAQARDAMAQQMFDLQKLQAQEKMLNADDLAKIYGERAEGAQKAAAAAELAGTTALNNAITGVANFATKFDDPNRRREYKPQMATSNTGANISGVTGTGDGYNFVNTSNQSPVGSMFGENVNMFSAPNPFVSAVSSPYVGASYAQPTIDMFGNIR